MKLIKAYVFYLPDDMTEYTESLFNVSDDMPNECTSVWRGYTNREAAEYAIGMLLQELWCRVYVSPIPDVLLDKYDIHVAINNLRHFEEELYKNVTIPSDFPIDFTVKIIDGNSILLSPVEASNGYRTHRPVSTRVNRQYPGRSTHQFKNTPFKNVIWQ